MDFVDDGHAGTMTPSAYGIDFADRQHAAPPPSASRMQLPASPIQRQSDPDEEELLQGNFVPKVVNNTAMPDGLKSGLEQLGNVALDDVRVHYNSPRPATMQAHATTQGTRIDIAPGQDRTLPHEGWHVVQQKQGRVPVTGFLEDGTPLNDNDALEAEADRMGAAAARFRGPIRTGNPLPKDAITQWAPVQRNYGGLNPMGQARVDQRAEEDYAAKALEFELGMAPIMLSDTNVGAAVDSFIVKIKQIVDAWAQHTSQQAAAAYEAEFGWPPGKGYYGAFEATAQNISAILNNPAAKPVRVKLKLIYNAVRNNSFAKWLKIAANELDRAAKGQAARDWKIRSKARRVESRPSGLAVRSRNQKLTVTTGFAADSGLSGALSPPEVSSVAGAHVDERQKPGWQTGGVLSSRRDVFDEEKFSNVVGWKPETIKANKERRGGASRELTVAEQRTVTVGDVNNLTDEEIDLALRRQGNHSPTALDRQNYRNQPATHLPWTQGGEFYDVELGSESAREAYQIRARMEAGISGSTDLMLHALNYLETSPVRPAMLGLRLALAGWMIANRDHSFYEVFKASAAYGMMFNTDPAHPGSEYLDAGNLSPMKASDFAGILPNDPPLNNPVPGNYLQLPWKDHLATLLGAPTQTQAQAQDTLAAAGINRPDQSVMTARETAALASLERVVAAQVINTADRPALKRWEVRRIKQHPSYILLANKFGEQHMERQLNQLLLQHHPGKGITFDDASSRLLAAGVPVVTVEKASAAERVRMDRLRQRVAAAVPVANAIAPADDANFDRAINQLRELTDEEKAYLKYGLIRHYHPTVDLTGNTMVAQTQDRIRQVEAIAATNRTTGTWYTWGPRAEHNRIIGNPSLLAATAAVPSTQGPGLYLGREITTSSSYGSILGRRAMVVRLNGVPTIDARNPEQRARLDSLQPRQLSADPLEAAYLFNRQVRAEFLMIYGAGNFARLTTKKNVELTLKLTRAPADVLRGSYRQPAFWVGHSLTNFQQQAAECGLNITGW